MIVIKTGGSHNTSFIMIPFPCNARARERERKRNAFLYIHLSSLINVCAKPDIRLEITEQHGTSYIHKTYMHTNFHAYLLLRTSLFFYAHIRTYLYYCLVLEPKYGSCTRLYTEFFYSSQPLQALSLTNTEWIRFNKKEALSFALKYSCIFLQERESKKICCCLCCEKEQKDRERERERKEKGSQACVQENESNIIRRDTDTFSLSFFFTSWRFFFFSLIFRFTLPMAFFSTRWRRRRALTQRESGEILLRTIYNVRSRAPKKSRWWCGWARSEFTL